MTTKKPTTGPVTRKRYRCTGCRTEAHRETNHWGQIYPGCPVCHRVTVWECMEPCPPTHDTPEPWQRIPLRVGESLDEAIDRLIAEGKLLPKFAKYYRRYLKTVGHGTLLDGRVRIGDSP